MSYKVTKTDFSALNGKSGKLHVSDQHVIFEGRDGTVAVLATAVRPRVVVSSPVPEPAPASLPMIDVDQDLNL